jgi:hypothetical protein
VPMLPAVPVSRKRKKKSGRSGRSRVPARVNMLGSRAGLGEHDRRSWRTLGGVWPPTGNRSVRGGRSGPVLRRRIWSRILWRLQRTSTT